MLYHYTFNTYSGFNVLEDKEIRDFLLKTFNEIADTKGFKIIICDILADHVHILIEQSYTLSTSLVMKYIKGVSSKHLFEKYPTDRWVMRKLWARSFHSRKIKEREKETVINYIRNQRTAEGIDKRF